MDHLSNVDPAASGYLSDLCFRPDNILSIKPENFPQPMVGVTGNWSPGDKPAHLCGCFL